MRTVIVSSLCISRTSFDVLHIMVGTAKRKTLLVGENGLTTKNGVDEMKLSWYKRRRNKSYIILRKKLNTNKIIVEVRFSLRRRVHAAENASMERSIERFTQFWNDAFRTSAARSLSVTIRERNIEATRSGQSCRFSGDMLWWKQIIR